MLAILSMLALLSDWICFSVAPIPSIMVRRTPATATATIAPRLTATTHRVSARSSHASTTRVHHTRHTILASRGRCA